MLNANLLQRIFRWHFFAKVLSLACVAAVGGNFVAAQNIIQSKSSNRPAAANPSAKTRSGSYRSTANLAGDYSFHVHGQGIVESNLVRLGDVVEISAPPAIKERLSGLPLGPSPAVGGNQRWTRNDILQMLVLRGFDKNAFRFSGAQFSSVTRSLQEKTSSTADGGSKSRDYASSDNVVGRRPSGSGSRNHPAEQKSGSSKRDLQFTPAYVDSRATTQATRNVTQAIVAYLNVRTEQTTDWRIDELQISEEFLGMLQQRKSIVGLAGGESPYTGEQNFTLLVRAREGESTVGVTAQIDLPPLVVAADGPIGRSHIFSRDDLKLVPLPKNRRVKHEECYLSFDELIGRESSRAFSSGQPITKSNTRIPRVIDRGAVIKIEVVSGGISIQTNGRALEPGGLNELINVEALPQRKRLLARVVDSGVVQVISSRTIR